MPAVKPCVRSSRVFASDKRPAVETAGPSCVEAEGTVISSLTRCAAARGDVVAAKPSSANENSATRTLQAMPETQEEIRRLRPCRQCLGHVDADAAEIEASADVGA